MMDALTAKEATTVSAKRHPRNTYSHPGVKEPIWLPFIHQPYFMVVKGEVVALREKIQVY